MAPGAAGLLVWIVAGHAVMAAARQNAPGHLEDAGGHSGKLLAVVVDQEALAKLNGRKARTPEPHSVEPRPLELTAWSQPNAEKADRSVILLVPFSAKVRGHIGAYALGSWPNENAASSGTRAAAYAAARSSYALPRGFIEVTKATAAQRVLQHFRLGDFLTKGQANVWPKYLVLDLKLVDKLELTIDALRDMGHNVKGLHVMSGFRTPAYNALDVGPGSRSAISRHMYGDAADVYPDDDGDGRLDDLNGDGRIDLADARVLAEAAEEVEARFPDLAGGIGIYPATAAHGPFVHIDARGGRARWGQ